ncbi:MAG TPA: M1 family aminopeptidase [Saprospiraceae bacterium]|nr:M1 family aminopeptidase [Saprospiraceae bacterium]HPN68779.1 M1 family aminopeptidase [Saprospiraceae bacterium]
MMRHLIVFEWTFYIRKISFYVLLLGFLAFGLLVGTSARIGFPNITYNSPYAINYFFGLFSLASLFPIVLMASQSLMREQDHRFEQILYTTSITNRDYFASRFSVVFGISILSFLLFMVGYMMGHLMKMDGSEQWGVFQIHYYFHSFLVIVLPNILLCTVLICCVAWFSKNKMLIYLSGLGIYILYMVFTIFSKNPLMSGSEPISETAMALSAKIDPFGMAAFFHQTNHWTAEQRNTEVLHLSGNVLFNRMMVVGLAFGLLILAYRFFRFNIKSRYKSQKNKPVLQESTRAFSPASTQTSGSFYFLSTIRSFLKIDLKSTIKSIPFVLLVVMTLFILAMEIYGAIEGGVRLPQYFATTALMTNTILATMPFILILAMLFYSSELVWKSKTFNFSFLEESTPFSNAALLISKALTLLVIILILIGFCIGMGVIFQVIYQHPIFEWKVYLSLFYFVGIPAFICSLLMTSLQFLFPNKYFAMAVSGIFLLFTNTSLGKSFGFSHPLTRFANFMPDAYSDLNGFGYLPNAFALKMAYAFSFVMLLSILTILMMNKALIKMQWRTGLALALPMILLGSAGFYLSKNYTKNSEEAELDWAQNYEATYGHFKSISQPTITDVKTTIDLYPERNAYHITGKYILVNKTPEVISEILINSALDVSMLILNSSDLILKNKDEKFGQYLFKTKKEMLPNDSLEINFEFEYQITPINGHQSFNAIVDNGAFMRISNYFPTIGYQLDHEISDEIERKKRAMAALPELDSVDAPIENPYNYQFINLNVLVSTSADQSAISVGELTDHYSKNDRNYFHFRAENIPFRFAISSAKYAVQKSNYGDVSIEIFHDPKHHQNIGHLIKSIQKTLAYCENNFGKYPYKTIRFAEISSFTRGFAATAYPATIYINEKQFHLNLTGGEGQDVINELAGHELSHQWWGNAQLRPVFRQGSGVLTETLAQYTQLMLYKNEYGEAKMLEMVEVYRDMYESSKAFSGEEALYSADPNNANVIYNKGLVKMYALYLLIGEAKINVALRSLLEGHRFPLGPATTRDLLEELRKVSRVEQYGEVERIFKL